MVRIRILRGQVLARIRSLTSGDIGGLMVAIAIVGASLAELGDAGDHSDSSNSMMPLMAPPVAAGGPSGEIHDPLRQGPLAEAAESGAKPNTGISPEHLRHPAHIFQLPPSVHNALVFDLENNRMHIYEATAGGSTLIGDYFVALGKNGIEKSREGDEKTPVGIYFVSSYIPGDSLPAIYGVGAFPITYPNSWDRRLGRTGSGIWIHGTDKDEASLLPQSSRGCLTLRNDDFLNLSQFVRIRRTPVIVTDRVSWTTPAALEADRASLTDAVEAWRTDWESLDNNAYFQHYSDDFRAGSMDRTAWTTYKKRVNSSKTFIQVGVDDLGIYAYPGEPELFLVTFDQRYVSNNFSGQKWKHQFWRREASGWRVVHESGG